MAKLTDVKLRDGFPPITVTLRINPYCNHPQFKDDCIYCLDAQLVFKKLLDIQRQTMLDKTKVDVLTTTNNKEA